MLERFGKDWRFRWHDEIEIVKTENHADFYVGRGTHCLENYYRSFYPFDQEETVGVEEQVTLQLDDRGRYRMRGIIDRVVRTAPGRYEVMVSAPGYKTWRKVLKIRAAEQVILNVDLAASRGN